MSRKHGLFLHKQANQNGSLASSHEHSWALRRKRIKKSKKNNCFRIRFLRWMVVSHLQKFICTSLVLWWMVEGVKDKTERTNKDQELIWIFYTWVGFFFFFKCRLWWTTNTSGNSFDWEVMWRCWEEKDLWSWAGQCGKDTPTSCWKTTKQPSSEKKKNEHPQLPWHCSTQIQPQVSQTLEAVLKLPGKDYKCWLQFVGKGN